MSLQYQIALTLIKGIGIYHAKNLIAHFGSAQAVFEAKKSALLKLDGIGEILASNIKSADVLGEAENHLAFIEKHKIKTYYYADNDYPKRLRQNADCPVLLYYKGNADLNSKRILSIVGTRNATAYGKLLCAQLVEGLKPYGVLVVSGLAHGIDALSHRECVNHGIPTVGVLGHGLDRIYPAVNKELATKMVKNGGLLTEFLSGTNPDAPNFPKRNRIIAGMADATIVVEASIKGGALITAEIASSYSRDIYAFPGRINDEFSEGCNFLIKTNRAGLINNAQDLIYYLGWDDEPVVKEQPIQTSMPINLNKEEAMVYKVLASQALGVDEISIQTKLAQSKLAIVLLTLEMRGIIIALPGKIYRLA